MERSHILGGGAPFLHVFCLFYSSQRIRVEKKEEGRKAGALRPIKGLGCVSNRILATSSSCSFNFLLNNYYCGSGNVLISKRSTFTHVHPSFTRNFSHYHIESWLMQAQTNGRHSSKITIVVRVSKNITDLQGVGSLVDELDFQDLFGSLFKAYLPVT